MLVPMPLKAIAKRAGVQPPTALAHLRRLEDDGKLKKVQTPEGPRYAVLPYLRCQWIDPDHGINATWQAQAIDWRFPLVARVPDSRAQDFLNEWLDRAQARGFLPAFRSKFEAAAHKVPSLQVVAYGSAARGDAGPNSDLDLLLVGDAPKKTLEALVDLAHEVALRVGRPPDIRIMDSKTWASAATAFKDAVRRDGKTVFSNDYEDLFLEKAVAATHG